MRMSSLSAFSRSSLMVRAARVLTPLAIMLGVGLATQASAQVDNRFTYQGELLDAGAPVDGVYDLRFRLYNAQVGPAQVGPQVSTPAVAVVGGRFNVEVNFGPGVFTGTQLWVEIDSRPSGVGGYVTLAPRQRLNATPFAAYSLSSNFATSATSATSATTANNALNLGGQPPTFYTNAVNLSSGVLPSARLTGAYGSALTLSNVGNVFFGSGANLTGINATNISSGTLSDAVLSANVARRDVANTFGGTNTFNADAIFNTEIGLGIATPLYPFHIEDTGGYATFVNNQGGAAFAGGYYANINSSSLQYGYISNLSGTGTGYGFYSISSAPSGYGVYVSNSGNASYGGYFNNTSASGATFGLYTENNSPDGYGIFARQDAESGTGPAVYAETDSNSGNAYAIHAVLDELSPGAGGSAIRGESRATNNIGYAVHGTHASAGYGVYGTAIGGRGVFGDSTSEGYGVYGSTDDGHGVYGIASPTTTSEICYGVRGAGGNSSGSYGVYGSVSGAGIGVYGYSTGGYGGYFDTGVSGGAALYVVGTASVGVLTIRGGADLAEKFEFNDQATEIKPGMVVMIDDEHDGGMELAAGAYNKRVAGVVSGAKELAAGMVLGDFDGAKNPHAVALTGRVWTYVDASEKAVEAGDLLTTSNTPGYAMPVIDSGKAHGATIGKAMTKLAKGEKGMVLVLVNLQ